MISTLKQLKLLHRILLRVRPTLVLDVLAFKLVMNNVSTILPKPNHIDPTFIGIMAHAICESCVVLWHYIHLVSMYVRAYHCDMI